jgi:hypothetical protein
MKTLVLLVFALSAVCCGAPATGASLVGLWTMPSQKNSFSEQLSLAADGSFDCSFHPLEQTKPAPDQFRHGTWNFKNGKLYLHSTKLAVIYEIGFMTQPSRRAKTRQRSSSTVKRSPPHGRSGARRNRNRSSTL